MSPFPVDPERLQRLAATRGGRVALGGFEYQRAFALLRLVSMLVGRAVRGTATEVPVWLRYEWAEDVDELAADGRVTLWQCKLGDRWTAPAALAGVLAGFAPKWLWTPVADRHRLQFRLVTSDPAYAAYADLPGPLPSEAQVRSRFLADLGGAPGAASDRAQWQADADAAGHGALFDGLWAATRVLHMPARSAAAAPAPWPAEDAALSVLALAHRLAPDSDAWQVVQALRGLLGVDPPPADAQQAVPRPGIAPLGLRAIDVADRLYAFGPQAAQAGVPLRLIDAPMLRAWQAEPPGARYVARRPEWPDVVRGADDHIGFFERTLTDDLVARLGRALADSLRRVGQLRLQWLVGAPGAGKSTLALRAAARLVASGACSVVDARFAVGEDDDIAALAAELHRLAAAPRPLLLLLDDPLGVGSRWPALLRLLSRGSPAVVVLAATPDFLLQRHQHELHDVAPLPAVELARPDAAERAALARLYPGLDEALQSGDEALLVLAMQAATGSSFDDIIRGQWRTLAGGRDLPADTLGRSLPWEVAAFWLVVFFHRAYAACPLSLLEGVLSARPGDGADTAERLAQLIDAQGWRIFQVKLPRGRFAYTGALVRAMHARVAQRAWDSRPAAAWRVAEAIAQASLQQPNMAGRLAEALAALHAVDPAAALLVMDAVAQAWAGPGAETLETRCLYEMHAGWTMNRMPVQPSLSDALRQRTDRCDAQSWLAALAQLQALAPDRAASASLDLRYDALVDAADFSLAPSRATRFANALGDRPALKQRCVQRLWRAFDGALGWQVDSSLLTWLLAQGGPDEVQRRIPALLAWVSTNSDDTSVRTAILGQLSRLSATEQPAILADYRAWLATHPDDTCVRTAFLGQLPRLGATDLTAVLADYRAWLAAHSDDTSVRAAFLGQLPRLGTADLTALLADYRAWLVTHPADVFVREKYLAQLNRMSITASDTDIRDAFEVLDRMPTDTGVRTSLLALLSAQRHPELADLLDRSLEALGQETRAFTPASAAVVAAATLGPTHLPLIVRWLIWAAEVLETFTANRSAESVARSLSGLIGTATRHASAPGCRPEDRTEAEAALCRVLAARESWNGSVPYLPTR